MEFGSEINEVSNCKANHNASVGIDLGNGTFNTATHVTANNNDIGVALLCDTTDPGNAVRVLGEEQRHRQSPRDRHRDMHQPREQGALSET